MALYRTLNPTTGQLHQEYPLTAPAHVEAALERAESAFYQWRELTFGERADRMRRLADLLDLEAETLAELMAVEMGKPRAEGIAEARKCAVTARWYADHAEALLAPVPHPSDASESWVAFEPLGAVLAIMPWNFPLWQVIRFAAPTLMAGNVALLKHAPNTPGCAIALAQLFAAADFPPGVFQSLFLDNDTVARLIADPRVAGVTLTGSTAAGRAVARAGGHALKPMVMELGGSDPFIVLPDADLDAAARTAVASRCLNSGQSCIAAKRFLVHESVAPAFTERVVEAMRARVVGDPLAEGVNIGPLARADLRDTLARQVEAARAAGARVLLGGSAPDGPGFFYRPTVLVNLDPATPIAGEEFFGPVAIIHHFENDDEMVALANGTQYGLGASLWTADRQRARALAPRLEAGAVFVNGMVKSDARLPFGGIKASGFGRELSREGLLAFVNQKTIWMA